MSPITLLCLKLFKIQSILHKVFATLIMQYNMYVVVSYESSLPDQKLVILNNLNENVNRVLILNMYAMYNMLLIASNLYIQLNRTKQDLSLRCTQKLNNFSLHTIFLSDIFTYKWLLDATRKFFNVLAHCKNFLKLIAYEKILLEVI